MSAFKAYLGDGVYVDYNGFGIILTTENGIETTNTIFLEPEVIAALDRYRERLERIAQQARTPNEDNEQSQPAGPDGGGNHLERPGP